MPLLHTQVWKRLKGKRLARLIILTNALAIAFEGYAQGVLGLINGAPNYLDTVGLSNGNSGVVSNETTLGGVTSIYYFGALVGAFWSGFLADKLGRVPALQLGCLWCILGTALEASAQNQNWQICARMIAGVGVGHMNVVAPTWTAEVSEAAHRGKLFALVYLANYGGICFAYWLCFGLSFIDHGLSEIRWRLPFGINAIFPALLFCILPLVPESPRHLVNVGKNREALEVLAATRSNGDESDPQVLAELAEIEYSVNVMKESKAHSSYWGMLTAKDKHFGRRAMLALWLSLLTQLGTGIVATTVYTPTLIQTAGWGTLKAEWLSALNNTVGLLGTVVAMYTIDPVGRRKSLLWGSLAQSAVMWIIGAMSLLAISKPDEASRYGAAAVSFIFIFTLIYSCTFLIINFNYASEIFPTELRSHGMAFGIAGWAIGLGACTLYTPSMFESIGGNGFFIFGGLNLVWFVLVYLFLPETSRRSLETIEFLFETESPFNRGMERHYQQRIQDQEIMDVQNDKIKIERSRTHKEFAGEAS